MLVTGFEPGMKRRELFAVLGGAVAMPFAASAQRALPPVVGFLGNSSAEEYAYLLAAWREGLVESGFVEARNLIVEYRWANDRSDRLPSLVADLVKRRVAVIMTSGGTPSALAAKAATSTIPIVFAFGSDPVKAGLVPSINKPGGNVTGVSFITTALGAKRLELLRELLPRAGSIGILVNPKNRQAGSILEELYEGSRKLGLTSHFVPVDSAAMFESAFATLTEKRVDAILVAPDQLFNAGRRQLIALASRHALPAIYIQSQFVVDGGLLSYGPSLTASYRQAGLYVGRILKGEKTANLPILLPTNFDLAINLKTANALGITVQPTLLARANKVIE
jgi:putative ABC transport system substrate-binding protein